MCSAKFVILLPKLVHCDVETSDALVRTVSPGISSHFHYNCSFIAASLIFHLAKLRTILSPYHTLLTASFLTSAEVQYLQKKVSISYSWEEDSIKVDIVPGDQEQQENQGLLSSSSNTVTTGT